MPPKRKAAAAKGRGGKKAKVEEPESEAPSTTKDAIAKLKAADAKKPKKPCKVDSGCHLASRAEVYLDYDCMLNQTNIGHNNNKFYIIQVLCSSGKYYAWNRWGRVGESGQNALKGPLTCDAAVADFKKKFQDKTRNKWENRESFKPVTGKYTLLLMDQDETEEEAQETQNKIAKLNDMDETDSVIKTLPCKLDKPTQALVKLIFDNDMFKEALVSYDIDVKKMPLGKLSKTQIAKGFEVLDDIEAVLEKKKKGNLVELTSKFYTLIPHAFGRQRPPPINTMELLRKKMDMLMVLADIEFAQEMQKEKDIRTETKDDEEKPHPLDANYDLLKCKLNHVATKTKDYKVIENYLKATESSYRSLKILDVWEVDRDGEGGRFDVHSDLDNRKLLWHGTNVAVVAAILKSGLRIMPHSGGRVGRGIYFASENGKSAGYVGCSGNTGIMFLTEVALGKEKHIKRDDPSLKTAPSGYSSIVAKGRTEPDPKKDTTIILDGNKVTVPQGKPVQQGEFSDSYFSQSEYLVYKESQARLRYLLKLKF